MVVFIDWFVALLVWPGDVPDLGVSVLAGGDHAGVVQPTQPGYLALKNRGTLFFENHSDFYQTSGYQNLLSR